MMDYAMIQRDMVSAALAKKAPYFYIHAKDVDGYWVGPDCGTHMYFIPNDKFVLDPDKIFNGRASLSVEYLMKDYNNGVLLEKTDTLVNLHGSMIRKLTGEVDVWISDDLLKTFGKGKYAFYGSKPNKPVYILEERTMVCIGLILPVLYREEEKCERE